MKKKKKSELMQWVAMLIISLVMIIVVIFDSSKKIIQRAESMIKTNTIQALEKYSERISKKLYDIQSDGELLIQLVEKGSLESSQQIQQFMEIFCEDEGISKAVYMENENVVVDFGNKVPDLSKEAYYEMIAEHEESSVLCIEDDEIADGKILLFMIPASDQGSGLFLYYPVEELKGLIDMSLENYRPIDSALMDLEGNILICTDEKNPFFSGGNFFDNVTEKTKSEILRFQSRVRSQGSGRADLAAGNQEGAVFHVPMGKEWVLVADYDLRNITRRERLIWNEARQMVLWVTGIILLLVLIYTITSIIARIRHVGESKVLEEKADMDLLTGLSNKIATERKIKEYISESPNKPAMMFVIDIDNFKKINDTMGHAFGDEVLRTLGKHIGENFRVTDIIGRTGGDEFTIFLKSLKDDEIMLREAKKLENFFKEFEAGEYVKYSATASIGAAIFPQDGENFETLYKAADRALYKAKERGKNQLAFYDDRDRE